MRMIVIFRYYSNLLSRVIYQRGYLAALPVVIHLMFTEAAMVVRWAQMTFLKGTCFRQPHNNLTTYSNALVEELSNLEVEIKPYQVKVDSFYAHVEACCYSSNYAAGSMDNGGMREQKLLEYFISLDLLDVQSKDVVLDVASEWSIFPEVVRKLTGATTYRQDLVYPPGVNNDHIGGNATCMPVTGGFFDKLVLHNAFEHFEGTADTEFILEAWRVLKPGGKLCILPLFVADRYSILTDPLVDRRGIVWDDGAQVIEQPWFHNRFGRFYDISALQRRVLAPGKNYIKTIYHILSPKDVHPDAYLYFALVMRKPEE